MAVALSPLSEVTMDMVMVSPGTRIPDVGEKLTLEMVGRAGSIAGALVATGEVVKAVLLLPAASTRTMEMGIWALSAMALLPSLTV